MASVVTTVSPPARFRLIFRINTGVGAKLVWTFVMERALSCKKTGAHPDRVFNVPIVARFIPDVMEDLIVADLE